MTEVALHDITAGITGLLGALIGGGSAVLAQHLLAQRQERMQGERITADKNLKEMEFDRLDAGVRRQLVALVAHVCTYVVVGRETGHTDYQALRLLLDRLNERIYRWEIPTALKDYEAEALYRAAEVIEIQYRTALEHSLDNFDGVDWEERAKREYLAKANFKESCRALCGFWASQGDLKRQLQFQSLLLEEKQRLELAAVAAEAQREIEATVQDMQSEPNGA